VCEQRDIGLESYPTTVYRHCKYRYAIFRELSKFIRNFDAKFPSLHCLLHDTVAPNSVELGRKLPWKIGMYTCQLPVDHAYLRCLRWAGFCVVIWDVTKIVRLRRMGGVNFFIWTVEVFALSCAQAVKTFRKNTDTNIIRYNELSSVITSTTCEALKFNAVVCYSSFIDNWLHYYRYRGILISFISPWHGSI